MCIAPSGGCVASIRHVPDRHGTMRGSAAAKRRQSRAGRGVLGSGVWCRASPDGVDDAVLTRYFDVRVTVTSADLEAAWKGKGVGMPGLQGPPKGAETGRPRESLSVT